MATPSSKPGKQAKNWILTINNPSYDLLDIMPDVPDLKYAIWQLETGENGTSHFQAFVMFEIKKRLNQLTVYFQGCHAEIIKGTPEQAKNYCSKMETRIGETSEFGIFPGNGDRGKRTDIAALHSALKSGLDTHGFSEQFFGFWMRFPDLVDRFARTRVRPRSQADPFRCVLIYGLPGLGKSFYAQEVATECARTCGDTEAYRKAPGKWWDGYRGQRVVIMDDFSGHSLSFTDFKLVCDRYPLRVECKGSSSELGAYCFYITTNVLPCHWWKEEITGLDKSAITRRFTQVIWFTGFKEFREFNDYQSFVNVLSETI